MSYKKHKCSLLPEKEKSMRKANEIVLTRFCVLCVGICLTFVHLVNVIGYVPLTNMETEKDCWHNNTNYYYSYS